MRVAESNCDVTGCCSLRTVDFVVNDPVWGGGRDGKGASGRKVFKALYVNLVSFMQSFFEENIRKGTT